MKKISVLFILLFLVSAFAACTQTSEAGTIPTPTPIETPELAESPLPNGSAADELETATPEMPDTAAIDWIDLGAIHIPSTWSFYEIEDEISAPPAISLFGEGANGTIHMIVWAVPFGDPSMLIDEFSSQQVFTFDDGRSGYMLEGHLFESDTLTIWYQPDLWIALRLIYNGNDSAFADNEELILHIARTLTSGAWTVSMADVVGVWRGPQNVEMALGHEEIVLNQNGTFRWEAYGRFYGTFTLDGNTLTLTATQRVSQELGGSTEDIERIDTLSFDRENQRLIRQGYVDTYFTKH